MPTASRCTACGIALPSSPVVWAYRGHSIPLCPLCAELSEAQRREACRAVVRQIDREADLAAAQAAVPRLERRSDIPEEQVEELLVTAFLDLIQERKLAGKDGLTATLASIAIWLRERTSLRVETAHVQTLALAMRDAGLLLVGGGGIGLPNQYDTRESEMGLDAFWDQVDAFLMVYRHPSRQALLLQEVAAGQAQEPT